MTHTEDQSVRAAVRAMVQNTSVRKVSSELGVTHDTVNSYLAGTHRAATAALIEQRFQARGREIAEASSPVEAFAFARRGKSLGISYR